MQILSQCDWTNLQEVTAFSHLQFLLSQHSWNFDYELSTNQFSLGSSLNPVLRYKFIVSTAPSHSFARHFAFCEGQIMVSFSVSMSARFSKKGFLLCLPQQLREPEPKPCLVSKGHKLFDSSRKSSCWIFLEIMSRWHPFNIVCLSHLRLLTLSRGETWLSDVSEDWTHVY